MYRHPCLQRGRLISLAGTDWQLDKLPKDHIMVPVEHVPSDDDSKALAMQEMENRWNELGMNRIDRNYNPNASPTPPR